MKKRYLVFSFYLTSCFLLANFVFQTSSEAKQCRLPSNPTSATCTPITTPPPLSTPTPVPTSTPVPTPVPTPPPCECPASPLCGVTQISTVEQFDLAGTASCSATKCSRFKCTEPPPKPIYRILRQKFDMGRIDIDPVTGKINVDTRMDMGSIVPLLDKLVALGKMSGSGNIYERLNTLNVAPIVIDEHETISVLSFFEQNGINGDRFRAWNYLMGIAGGGIHVTTTFASGSYIPNVKIENSGNYSVLGKCMTTGCFVDENGDLVDQNSSTVLVGGVDVRSPISLILSSDQAESISASQFSLGSGKGWYQWKASANRPLLVYDPKHTGQTTSASQLFGNYTFGKSWPNGYEALATLDTNHDNKVSGSELQDLALWFDNNQDGISDKGEVKKLNEVGITALFFEPSSSDIETRDIKAHIGYEREVCVTESLLTKTCHKEIGQSVDWYGAGPFETKEEAILGKKYLFGMGFSNIQKQFLR